MSIRLEPLTEAHIPEAIALAASSLAREARHVPALAKAHVPDLLAERVDLIVRTGIGGIAAMDGDRLAGYIVFHGPIPSFFGTADGAYAPLHGHAVTGDHRERLYALMLQHAADRLVGQRLTSLAVTAYAHDEDVSRALQMNGFGIRCADAIRDLSAPDSAPTPDGYTNTELTGDDVRAIVPLENALIRHLRSSPTFLPVRETTEDAFTARHREQGSRFFATLAGDEIVGYIKVTGEGETFLTLAPHMPNITGAYLLPEHRGRGVYDGLLAFTIDTLRNEGATVLGVDFETMNPTALHFWEKTFDIYTHSYVRRIDDGILEYVP